MPTNVTPISGLSGSGRIGGATIVNLKNWDMSRSQKMNDISAFGDKDQKIVPGLRSATANVSGQVSTNAAARTVFKTLNSTVAAQTAATWDLIISTVAGKKAKYTGSAYISGDGASDSFDGIVEFNAALTFNGGLRYSTT